MLQALSMAQSAQRSKLQKKLNTKTRSAHPPGWIHKDKNNNHINLTLCSLWSLGVFVFEDFIAKNCVQLLAETKTLLANIIAPRSMRLALCFLLQNNKFPHLCSIF